jgi:hypothetical protein
MLIERSPSTTSILRRIRSNWRSSRCWKMPAERIR